MAFKGATKAWQLFEDRSNWITTVLFAEADGYPVNYVERNPLEYQYDKDRAIPSKPERVCRFCAGGAMSLVYDDQQYREMRAKLLGNVDHSTIWYWNDISNADQVYNKLKELDI